MICRLMLFALVLACQPALADERVLTDGTGRTVTVPETPQAIVTLHEPLLGLAVVDLGGNLVGSYGRNDEGENLSAVDFFDTVFGEGHPPPPPGIGPLGNIDLEKLRVLNPDLIIGTEHDVDKAARLSTVAPVYLQKSSTGDVYGFRSEQEIADLLNRQEAFAIRRNAYESRLQTIGNELPFDPAEKTYLAIIVHDQINVVGDMSGLIQAIEDLGYTRAEVENTGASKGLGSTFAVPLSAELFVRLNPDLLIVINSYAGTDRDETAIKARLDRIAPGWDKFMKPAQEDRILYLDSAKVSTPTVASAENTLDAYEAWVQQ